MKLSVHTSSQAYELNLLRITQLCGTDFRKKQYILKSLRKHFSSSKYSEYEGGMINNIEIDNEIPGREYFEVYSIETVRDILKMIQLGKNTLMSRYIKMCLQASSLKDEMQQLEFLTDDIFYKLNQNLFEEFQYLRLSYSLEKLFDIIQKSEIVSDEREDVEALSDFELLKIFLLLIEQIQRCDPRKIMIIIENIDHFIEFKEYEKIFRMIQNLCNKYDIWCIFSMSTSGYVYIDHVCMEGINIINDEIFTLPQLRYTKSFVEQQYPCHIDITDEEVIVMLRSIIHRIGNSKIELNQKSDVLLKMINGSLCIDTKVISTLNNIEKSFLAAEL